MVHAAFLRSPYPHGRILAIDATAAAALPGVVLVATGRDIAALCRPFAGIHRLFAGMKAPLQHALAVDRVTWQGEPFVAVAAETRAIAEDALDLIECDIEPLEGIGDLATAAAADTFVIHPEIGSNVAHEMLQESGDLGHAFEEAAVVVEDTFSFARHTGVCLETRSIIADFEARDRALTVYQSHQCPAQQQDIYARLLGLSENRVRVVCPDVGGAFGIKQQLYGDEIAVCALSMMLGRPVKFVADRLESFASDIHAREHVVRARMAVSAEGRILGLDVDDLFGIGAYSQYPRSSIGEGSHVLRLTGAPYRMDAYRARVRMVMQNKALVGHYRAVGHPIATAVGEALVDRAASALGKDPISLRRLNYIKPENFPFASPGGFEFEQLSLDACLDRFLEVFPMDAFRREQTRARQSGIYRGVGLATFVELTGTGPDYYGRGEARVSAQDGCLVRLEPSGVIRCFPSTTDQGQGIDAAIGQVVAQVLGVPYGHVEVVSGDSASAPYGGGAWASRGASTGAEAAFRSASALRSEILGLAGHLLQYKPGDLTIAQGEIRDVASGRSLMPLSEIGRIGYFRQDLLPAGVQPNLSVVHYFAPQGRSFLMTNGLHVSVAEVDPGLGVVKLLRHLVVHDSGTVLNPRLLDEQIRGGVVQGLGAALLEEIRYGPGGELLTGSLADYLVPLANEMPDIEVHHVCTPDPATTLGAKGAGEAGTAGSAAAVLNAVNDALRPFDVWINALPITPQKLLEALGKVRSPV
jgi:carbon-monoxide dehydrogenase large subunit